MDWECKLYQLTLKGFSNYSGQLLWALSSVYVLKLPYTKRVITIRH